ncbi:MAG TPA: DUF2723 domain-containing protein [Candidatus Anoxymicrobiaceae bacterium]
MVYNRGMEQGTGSAEASRAAWLFGRQRANRDAAVLAALFVATFSMNILTAAHTVTFSDSGDFLMAISTVGNVHGPGYPLYAMSAKVFTLLLPFGSLAFRVSVFSGLFAALTVCLIYWILRQMTRSRIAGVVAGLAFAFSYTFWYQTSIPETYSLDTFFIALLVVLALRWTRQSKAHERNRAVNTLCLFALVAGLAMTNHYTIAFLFPVFIAYALFTDWRSVVAPRNLLKVAAFFALGLLPYLYIPIAAFRGPAYNYGDPATFTGWLRLTTLYWQRGGLFNYPWAFYPARFARYFATLNTEFPYFAWVGGLGLLCSFLLRKYRYALLVLFLFLMSLLPVMTYFQSEPVLRAHFYYPSYFFFSLWIGFGVAWTARMVKKQVAKMDRSVETVALALGVVVLMAIPAVALGAHFGKVDKSQYDYAKLMGEEMLLTAKRDGVVLTDSDNAYFPTRYLQVVEGLRTDVRVVNPNSARVPGYLATDLLDRYSADYQASTDSQFVQVVRRNDADTPVYASFFNFVATDWRSKWLGYLVRLTPLNSSVKDGTRLAGQYPLSAASNPNLDSDGREAVLMPEVLKGMIQYGAGDDKAASVTFGNAITLFQKDLYVPTLYSCSTFAQLYEYWGRSLNRLGRQKDTARLLPGARAIDPDFVSLSLAQAYEATGDRAKALAELDRYLGYYPGDAAALIERADVEFAAKDYPKAVADVKSAIGQSPANARALVLYGRLLLARGQAAKAREQFRKAISVDPISEWAKVARQQLK